MEPYNYALMVLVEIDMKKAYISGPLRASTPYHITQNIDSARREAEDLWKIGFAVLCPHLNTLNMIGLLGNDDGDFIKGDLLLLEGMDCIVMIPGWENSGGANAEHERAIELNLDVFIAERTYSWLHTDNWTLNGDRYLNRDDMMDYTRLNQGEKR